MPFHTPGVPQTLSPDKRTASAPTMALGAAFASSPAARRTESQVLPPHTVVGTYRILSVLGEGGMGYVYLAEHIKLGRRVALKMLRSEYADNPNAVRRFFDEARAVNQIRHENIIEVTDFFEGQSGEPSYFIMELLVGSDVAQLEALGPVGLRRALHITRQVASALAAAHQTGIVHRDLKPENIFLVERRGDHDFVKLLDFGVAKLADPLQQRGETRTQAGAILGTPEYMSPEQAGGTEVDSRTDVYAFGVILYEMIAGRRPFEGRSFGDFVIAHLSTPPVPPSQVPGCPQPIPVQLEALTLRCLAKQPINRPQSMLEIEAELATIEAELGHSPTSVVPLQLEPPPPAPRRRAPAVMVAALGVLVCAGAIAFTAHALHSARVVPVASTAAVPRIKIHFDSNPPGAEVLREGTEVALGLTPLEWTTDQANEHARFEFRFPGRDRAWSDIELTHDSNVAVTLVPAAPPPVALVAPPTAAIANPPAAPGAAANPRPKAKTVAQNKHDSSPSGESAEDRDAIADPFAE